MNKYNENKFVLRLCKINTYRQRKIITLTNERLVNPYVLDHLSYNLVDGDCIVSKKEICCSIYVL